MIYFPIETETFTYQHLFDSETNAQKIKNFSVNQPSGKGLENYLKLMASSEEASSFARTYLVMDKFSHEVASYFTLKTGLFTLELSDDYFYTIPSIELADFAVNSEYRAVHPEVTEIGKTTFREFIIPLVHFMRSFVGVKAMYIYALNQERLIHHYEEMGFKRLSPEKELFVHQHVKPKYDDGCIFMYQLLG